MIAVEIKTRVGVVTVERSPKYMRYRPSFTATADFGGSKHYGYGPKRADALEDLKARLAPQGITIHDEVTK